MKAFPKSPRQTNPRLLALAKDKPCLMLATENCRGLDGSTTVSAHCNELRCGKGRGMKAHDYYSVWSCANCHQWYDESGAPKAEKQQAFDAAQHRQVRQWAAIHCASNSKDAQAAGWALDALGVISSQLA